MQNYIKNTQVHISFFSS